MKTVWCTGSDASVFLFILDNTERFEVMFEPPPEPVYSIGRMDGKLMSIPRFFSVLDRKGYSEIAD